MYEYNPEKHGNLIDYLLERISGVTSNLFLGPEHFLKIRDLDLMIPNISMVRISIGFTPDIIYTINNDFLLEGSGSKKYNMSTRNAKKGIYNPKTELKEKFWSIEHLNTEKLHEIYSNKA